MYQTSADIQDNLMLKKGVPNRNKILETNNFISQTAGNLQQSVEYDWFYTDDYFLLFAKKIILLSDQFCLISQVAEIDEKNETQFLGSIFLQRNSSQFPTLATTCMAALQEVHPHQVFLLQGYPRPGEHFQTQTR